MKSAITSTKEFLSAIVTTITRSEVTHKYRSKEKPFVYIYEEWLGDSLNYRIELYSVNGKGKMNPDVVILLDKETIENLSNVMNALLLTGSDESETVQK